MCQRPIVACYFIVLAVLTTFIEITANKHNRDYEPRISNGQEAAAGQFPFIVLINGNCAGSILTPEYVLTAGHCVAFLDGLGALHLMPRFILMFGQIRISNNPNWVFRDVDKVFLHENHTNSGDLTTNDIAILKLEEPVEYSATIQPVKLPPRHVEGFEEMVFTALGWGFTETGRTSDYLMHVEMQGVSQSKCKEELDAILTKKVDLLDGMMCATYTRKIPVGGICHGDSGGPLVMAGTNTIVGISSWGAASETCLKPHPDGFTRVSYYLDWIHSHIGEI